MATVMQQGVLTKFLTLTFMKSTLAHYNINLIDFQSIVSFLGSSGCIWFNFLFICTYWVCGLHQFTSCN